MSFFCLRLFSSTITSASHPLLNNSSITCFEFVDDSSSLFTNSITFANSLISNFKSSTHSISSDSLIIASKIVVIYEHDFLGSFVNSTNLSKYSDKSLVTVKILASSIPNLYSQRYFNLFSIGNSGKVALASSIKLSFKSSGNKSGSGKYL